MKEKTNENNISKKMSFAELISKYPEAGEVLMDNGMHCFGCAMASFETLEQGCLAHGLNPNEIVKQIQEKINKKINKK